MKKFYEVLNGNKAKILLKGFYPENYVYFTMRCRNNTKIHIVLNECSKYILPGSLSQFPHMRFPVTIHPPLELLIHKPQNHMKIEDSIFPHFLNTIRTNN